MKRAVISLQMLPWALRVIFVVAVLITLILFINAHANAKITIFNAEASSLTTRLLYHEGIMQHDATLQRLEQGTVDAQKCKTLTDAQLDKSVSYGANARHIAGAFSVVVGARPVCGAVFSRDYYEFLDVQRRAGGVFGTGVSVKTVRVPVRVSDGTAVLPGTMEITILGES